MLQKIKNKSLIKFARFGGLSPVIQKGYDAKMPGFHSPPKRKGIYCFIYPYYEPFLLGGDFSNINTKHPKFEYVKDVNGDRLIYDENDINNEEKWDKNFMKFYSTTYDSFYDSEKDEWITSDKKVYWVKPKKPKIFTHTQELWHHLGRHLKPFQIIQQKGSWYLTQYKDFEEAFKKEKSECVKFQSKDKIFGKLDSESFQKAQAKPFMFQSIDHLEVFIERVK